MRKIEQKLKSARDHQLSSNSRAARKRAKQDVINRMDMKYLEIKTRGGVYRNVKKASIIPFLLAQE